MRRGRNCASKLSCVTQPWLATGGSSHHHEASRHRAGADHMPAYAKLPEIAVVTGAAGFIGSHLVEALLQLGVTVRGLDNLSTGTTANLDSVRERVGDSWRRFEFINGDVRFAAEYEKVLRGSDAVFHQAAMNSVPRSIEMPVFITDNNVIGMAALLQAAVDAKVPRFLYASSSSVYGNI